MSNYLYKTEQVGTYTSGYVDVIGTVICDSFADLPAPTDFQSDGVTLKMGSTAIMIDSGDIYKMDSAGVWMLQPSPTSLSTTVTLDLTGYYNSTQTDSAISAAITDFQTNTADHRYLRIGTGSALANNTDLDTVTTIGKYYNGNSSNGCSNMPSEVAGRPFTISVENTANSARVRQTMWMSQSGYIDRFYWRAQYTSGGQAVWSPWYKVTGTAV